MSENTKEDYPDLPKPDTGLRVSIDEKLSGATPGGALIIVRNLLNNDEVRRQIFYSSTEHATSAEELQVVEEDFEPTHEATVIGFEGHDGTTGYIIAPNAGQTRFHEPNHAGEVKLRPLRPEEVDMLGA